MNYYLSPRWSGEIYDCSMPMTFDTYNLCTYRCLYCFSYYQRAHSSKSYMNNEVKYVNVARIKKLFRGELKNSQFNQYIKDKKVMQWGGLSEPFDPIDKKYGVTLELLRFFKEINYPLSFSTKANWMVHDKRYRELIKDQKNWHFKVTIITDDEEIAKQIEVGCPTPDQRIDTIKQLRGLGIPHVTLRLRPFIIGITNKTVESLLKKVKEAGADSVSTEFFCLEKRADKATRERYKKMSEQTGYDLMTYYKRHSYQEGYQRLNYELKRPYIERLQKACKELGLRLYVSDAHHKEKCANGSCCGLPCSMNYSRGQFTEAIAKCKENGKVSWGDIKKDVEYLKKVPFYNAEGFNTSTAEMRAKRGRQSMYDYLHEAWNNPNLSHSPYKYFDKVMYPVALDDNNDIIYQYNPERKKLKSSLKKL